MDTGFARQDAQTDFSRARRRATLSRLATRLRRQPSDVTVPLPFEEVVEALGRTTERRIGMQSIPVDSIVGTVDRSREFDRSFRPASPRVRRRWERVALASRRGESLPPIDVYRIGNLHFVKDGHHRVSVARHFDLETIDAYVTVVETESDPDTDLTLATLPVKSHERLFYERVPLPREARERIRFSRPADGHAELAEAVEAWGFRMIQGTGELLDRVEVADAWYRDEYVPVVEALREADLIGEETETDAYLRVGRARYMLLRTHEWGEDVIARLREELA